MNSFKNTFFLVRLLEQGFEEAVTKIILKSQNPHQTVLLSATLSTGMSYYCYYLKFFIYLFSIKKKFII